MDIEKELLEACKNEERRAQNELYKRCYSILMSVCMRYERNKEDAEFMLNKVFFKILKHLDSYDENAPFEAWIRRIAINTQIDQYRKDQRRKEQYVEEPMHIAPLNVMDYNEAEQKFDAEELLAMIRQLPPMSQKVFNLYTIDGYSHKEIGAQLDISDGTSKWHLSSARSKLKVMVHKMMNHVALFILMMILK